MLRKRIFMRRWHVGFAPLAIMASWAACSSSGGNHAGPNDAGKDGAHADAPVPDGAIECAVPPSASDIPAAGTFCSLPGSVISTANGPRVVPGGPSVPCLGWMSLPVGFCAHYYAHVPTTRQLRFAPDGALFVASPTQSTTGGAGNGVAGVVVAPDLNKDGVADSTPTFVGSIPSVQGLLFRGNDFYFQDDVAIRHVVYKAGDTSPSSPVTTFATISARQAPEHWPKVFDVAKDGTFYVTNGGSQSDACVSAGPVRGSIFSLAADGSATLVAKGFRNPIALRCETDHDVCLAAELALDYSAGTKGREKIVPVRAGDDWGYPCCATKNTPYAGTVYVDNGMTPDCSGTASESDSFLIGHTPFGIDFETGKWPAPWSKRAFVTLHGVFGTWEGARIVGIALDPTTGLPLPASDIDGGESLNGNMKDFAIGWDDHTLGHGRPAAVTFAPDGRLFVGDDQQGVVLWIAPVDLKKP